MASRSAVGQVLLLASFLGLASTSPAFSQATGATLQGVVTDEQGGALPGASVTITNTETGLTREVVTEANGRYRAAALPPAHTKSA